MNRIYALVWNFSLGLWQVASELQKSGGKRKNRLRRGHWLKRLAALGLVMSPLTHADTLPGGGNIVAGSGSINGNGSTLNINQNSDKLVINWDSFSIGKNNTVNFVQPNSDSAALNRVTGNSASEILGNLNANGRVFLINPNGISFSDSARVDVGSLVASTLDISTADFLNGNYQFSGNSSNAVVNQGNITTINGGTVAMIAAEIINTGNITTPQGNTLMGAGSKVTLDLGGPVKIEVEQATLDTYIEQGGAIRADGGFVYLTAKAASDIASSVINHTGITQAQTLASGKDGQIFLMGDMQHGSVALAGTLDASAPQGDGGFVETSAASVDIGDISVTTKADNGETGTWLIDPTDFTISAGNAAETDSGIGANTLSSNLENNNIELTTASPGTDAGNIFVDSAVSWSSNNRLTLTADNTISINANINGSALTLSANGGGITLAADIITGALSMTSGGTIQQTGGALAVAGTTSLEATGNINLTSVTNDFGGTLNLTAANASVTASNSLSLGSTDTSNLTLTTSGSLSFNQDVSTGTLTINAGVSIVANGIDVDTFILNTGDWLQVGSSLPAFSADDFQVDVANASFFRFLGGGTTYQITDIYGLQGMGSHSLLNNNFLLANNIDASGTANWNSGAGFDPIGDSGHQFTGTLDGMGYEINGLTINRSAQDYVGLFGYTGAGSSITNLGLTNANITGYSYVGGLVGFNDGDINNSYASGNVTGSSIYSGGLVGYNDGDISNSYATSDVSGQNSVGGLAGINTTNGIISNSYATGAVSGTYTVGGLVGLSNATISNSYATGSVSGTNNVGGLMGINNNNATISNSYAVGTVSGTGSYVGGLVGYNTNNATISNGYATGTVSGTNNVGGLVGYNNAHINISYATGDVSGNDAIAGLVGYNSNNGTISNSYAAGTVSGTGIYAGGLVGANLNTISNSYATGTVSGTNTVGGLVGYNAGIGTISNSFWNTETSGTSIAVGLGTTSGVTGLTTAQMFDSATFTGFDFDSVWANADNQTTPYLRGLSNNQVFNINDLPSGTISPSNLPAFYTVIQNIDQLQAMQNNLAGRYLLGNNIDASGTASWNSGAGFDPIGDDSNNFTGMLDGMGFAIDGLTIDRSTQDYVGLFGYTGTGSHINNIGLTNIDIAGYYFVGGLVGESKSTINNSYATGNITGRSQFGGLVGFNSGDINNSYASGNVTGPSIYSGGLAGVNNGSISNSYATNDVSGEDFVGGLAGINTTNGMISNSYATGAVSGTNTVGGLVGANINTISNSYATGSVLGRNNVGGLVGFIDTNANISNSYAVGTVSGTNTVGGLVGENDGDISNSYAAGTVSGTANYVGGLVGFNNGGGDISNSYATGAVSGTDFVGGLVAYNSGNIESSYSMAAVSGTHTVGGLVGYNNSTIRNSFWNTDTVATGMPSVRNNVGTVYNVTGRTTAQMQQLDTFTAAGWDINADGSGSAIWRIYEGQTSPLLRAFMTDATVSGTPTSQAYTGDTSLSPDTLAALNLNWSPTVDMALILGELQLAASDEGPQSLTGLYSTQQGYNIMFDNSLSVTVGTPASTNTNAVTNIQTDAAIASAQQLYTWDNTSQSVATANHRDNTVITVEDTGILLPE